MRKSLSLFMAVMLLFGMTSLSFAFNETDHVQVSPNMKGDLVIYPFYLAAPGGWETRLTVINTNTTLSAVAKIVFRSYKYSLEVLDFLLYLSPNDVWTGTVKISDAGLPVIYSTDSSSQSTAGVWASAATPLNQQLFTPKIALGQDCANDSNLMGYAKIILSWTGDINAMVTATPALIRTGESQVPPVSKSLIARAYNEQVGGGILRDLTPDILTGFLELVNANQNLTSAVEATVLSNYDNTVKLNVKDETFMGDKADNFISEVEAALSKNNLVMPYVSRPGELSAHVFTFPAKESTVVRDPVNTKNCRYRFANGWYWRNLIGWAVADLPETDNVTYVVNPYNMEEVTRGGGIFSGGGEEVSVMRDEMNILVPSPGSPFTEGWIRYAFPSGPRARAENTTILAVRDVGGTSAIVDLLIPATRAPAPNGTLNNQELRFSGAPVIGTVFSFKDGSMSLMKAAHDNGVVGVNGVAVPNYQFNSTRR